ncbi:uncharacterized protein LOC135466719 [Liolophura sinensis]|uniref:uncharacterized protein LOC135466719 n=1 Tax=Liolophura sinensis TaxID=3198878 RepID=UPI0031597A6A
MNPPTSVQEGLKNAIKSGRTDVVRSVLATLEATDADDRVADPSASLDSVLNGLCCEEGTPLHLATKLDQPDTVRTLLSAGADAGVQNSSGQTPFELVNSEQVKDVFNQELLQATAQSNIGRVCQLLAAGVDVNLVDSHESKNTPLHWAATYGSWQMVQSLCSRGASVLSVNGSGCTPLHDAVRRGDPQVIEELLVSQADPHVTITEGNDKGKNAFDLAAGRPELLNLLNHPPERLISDQVDPLPEKTDKVHSISSLTSTATDTAKGDHIPNGPVPHHHSPQLTSPTFEKASAFSHLTDPPKPVITDETLGLLWPQPQMILQKEGRPFCPEKKLPVYIADGPHRNLHEVLSRWQMRQPMFKDLGIELCLDILSPTSDYSSPHIICHLNPRLCTGPGSYRLNITHKQLKLICDDLSGLNYAISTLIQLFRLYKDNDGKIPLLQIDDWAEFRMRGVLVDISQGRVPNMTLLRNTIDVLSLMRVSHIHLYSRFKDTGTPEWQLCYSRSEILELEQFCRLRSIQLIPVLEVTHKTHVEDVNNLYTVFQDFVSSFTQADFVSVGPRLSSFILDTPDDETLNVSDALKFLPIGRHQTMMLCGYPLHDLDPILLQQLPPDLIFMQYGVQADHSFKTYCSPLAETGLSFCVCPGTSAWNSLAGCPEAAVSNVFNGVRSAVDQGAIGVIVCDWSGKGHLTHQPFSWPAYLIGAGLSWNSDTHWDYLHSHLADLLNQHVFRDQKSVIGRAIIELGRAETYVLRCSRSQSGTDISRLPDEQGSTLFQFLVQPDEVPLENLTLDILQKSIRHIKRCQVELSNAELYCYNHKEIVTELQLTSDLMLCAVRIGRALVMVGRNPGNQTGFAVINLGIANLPATSKTDLANKLLELLGTYKSVWRASYMPQGLNESVHTLQSLLKQLVPEEDGAIYDDVQKEP